MESFEEFAKLMAEYMKDQGLPTVTVEELQRDYSGYCREEEYRALLSE